MNYLFTSWSIFERGLQFTKIFHGRGVWSLNLIMTQNVIETLIGHVFGLIYYPCGLFCSRILHGNLIIHGLLIEVYMLTGWTKCHDISTTFDDKEKLIAIFALSHRVMSLLHKLVFHLLCDKTIVILIAVATLHERYLVLHIVFQLL